MRLALLLCLFPATANACWPHDAATLVLAERYGESRQMIALQSDGNVLEIYAADNGTWTALITTPAGASCIVASGQNYEHTNEPFPAKGVDG